MINRCKFVVSLTFKNWLLIKIPQSTRSSTQPTPVTTPTLFSLSRPHCVNCNNNCFVMPTACGSVHCWSNWSGWSKLVLLNGPVLVRSLVLLMLGNVWTNTGFTQAGQGGWCAWLLAHLITNLTHRVKPEFLLGVWPILHQPKQEYQKHPSVW